MIIDTTFLIDLMREDANALKKLAELEEKNTTCSITTVSVFELFAGAECSRNPRKEQQKIERVLNEVFIVPFTVPAAQKAGLLKGALLAKGKQISTEDMMIAGTALLKNEMVLTRNAKHFKHIEGLRVETY